MLVIVDAGQGLVWVAVEVRVLPTHVAVASPAHVALKKEEIRGWEAGKGPGRINCCPCRYPLHPAASPSSCPRPPTHRAGNFTVPLEHAEAVDVAGVGGGSAAGLLQDAAGCLIPDKP